MKSSWRGLSRRDVLKSLTAVGLIAAVPRSLRAAAPAASGGAAALNYLRTLARDDGGYAWGDQEHSHLTPTFAAIGCHHLLRQAPPNRAALERFVREHHPRELKKLEQERRTFDFQQVQALAWLGADLAAFRPQIAKLTQPLSYLKQYEQHGYPVMQSELGAVLLHALVGLPVAGIADGFGHYVEERQRPNGSFNNTPARDGGDGHVMNTLWALQALGVLGLEIRRRSELIRWLQACQRPNGGFTFAPRPECGGVDDVAYTRAAVRALRLLGAPPADRDGCERYLRSLVNPDGGFGDRPGWASNAVATYGGLDACDALGMRDVAGASPPAPRVAARGTLPEGLKIFSIQIEAHGQGSPADAVELARSLKIDLWGAKNARPGWIARARALAAEQRVPVTFFTANEEYGTWVNFPGFGTYSHTSDIIAPAEGDIGRSLAREGTVTWPDFRARRLEPLQRGGGRLVWQFGENEELVRMLLDDSVERGGFAAISTFHFGNPDFMNTEPFLNRWRGRIPFIALQDAHGPEPWWFADQTSGLRTLFLAREPTWDAWLHALQQNWVVAVRRDGWTKGRTWMHSGSDVVLQEVRAREADWRWWNHSAADRPMVSLVPIRPEDTFEAGRPESGVALRVRCAGENTPQGLLKTPLAELVSLSLDGRAVTPTKVARQRPNGLYDDLYHLFAVPAGTARGRHTASAVVRVLATQREVARTVEFDM